jgi:hypothetical protein
VIAEIFERRFNDEAGGEIGAGVGKHTAGNSQAGSCEAARYGDYRFLSAKRAADRDLFGA